MWLFKTETVNNSVAIYDINIHLQDNHNIFIYLISLQKFLDLQVFILTPKDLPFTKLDLVPLFKP